MAKLKKRDQLNELYKQKELIEQINTQFISLHTQKRAINRINQEILKLTI